MPTAAQIARRTEKLAKWREDSLVEFKAGVVAPDKVTPEQLRVFEQGYRQGWNDLAGLMTLHEQFKDNFAD